MKLVTFQGVSAAGKSTLAYAVAEAIGVKYINPYMESEAEIKALDVFPFLHQEIKNVFAYAVCFHKMLQSDGWVVFDHGLELRSLSSYFSLDGLEQWHFVIYISFDVYAERLKKRGGIPEISLLEFNRTDMLMRDNEKHGAIPLDGHLPVDENVSIVLEYINAHRHTGIN